MFLRERIWRRDFEGIATDLETFSEKSTETVLLSIKLNDRVEQHDERIL